MEFQYKLKNDKESRKKESNELLEKHPDKLPIILEKDPSCKLKEMKKKKYLLLKKSTISQLQEIIKRKTELPEKESLFLQVRTKYGLSGETTIEDVYSKYKDQDGFLYIMYTSELIYG